MKKKFVIEKTPEVRALILKHENYKENFALDEEDERFYYVAYRLPEKQRILLFAYMEHRSIRKLMAFFGSSYYLVRDALNDLKKQMAVIESKRKK